jgi:hypothetical protein
MEETGPDDVRGVEKIGKVAENLRDQPDNFFQIRVEVLFVVLIRDGAVDIVMHGKRRNRHYVGE